MLLWLSSALHNLFSIVMWKLIIQSHTWKAIQIQLVPVQSQLQTEAYLRPWQLLMMGHFCENTGRLKAAIFPKKRHHRYLLILTIYHNHSSIFMFLLLWTCIPGSSRRPRVWCRTQVSSCCCHVLKICYSVYFKSSLKAHGNLGYVIFCQDLSNRAKTENLNTFSNLVI